MRLDLLSLAAGAVIAALGALILLDSSGAIDLTVGWVAVALTGGVGGILLVGGLADGDADRHASSGGRVRRTAAGSRRSY
jgi:hypothetical protein